MVKASELRIGNWIDSILRGNGRVHSIKSQPVRDGDYISVNGNLQEHFNPIPITPIILEKCGFERKELPSNFCGGQGGYQISIMQSAGRFLLIIGDAGRGRTWLYDSDNVYNGQPLGDVYKLHELQNLFYYLTGEDFIVNL